MITAPAGAGVQLADRLGLSIIGRERHDLKVACIACDSSDACRIHSDRGVWHCYACDGSGAPFDLAVRVLGDREAAKQLLIDIGIFEARRNGHAATTVQVNGHAIAHSPIDPIDVIARAKRTSADGLRRMGLAATPQSILCTAPMYGPDGQQCSTWRISAIKPNEKGEYEKGKPSGVFLSHDGSGQPILPQPGQTCAIGEGIKDPSAIVVRDYADVVMGSPTSALPRKFARLLRGVHVLIFAHRDIPGENGAIKTASRLAGVAASVRIVRLPSELRPSHGEDVRDILARPDGEQQLRQAIDDAREYDPTIDRIDERRSNPKAKSKSKDDLRPGFEFTDMGNAARFVAQHGRDIRFVFAWSKWLCWDGCRWRIDSGALIEKKAKQTILSIAQESVGCTHSDDIEGILKWALASQQASRVPAMLRLARSEVAIDPERLDNDPWLLNCSNGTLDLRTGSLRPADRNDYLTKLCPTPYDPAAECPRWQQFLREIFVGFNADKQLVPNEDLIGYIQRAAGYTFSGDVSEHCLFVCHGTGSNGKSVFLETLQQILGPDYAMKAAPDLLMVKRGDTHPTERADLFGRRLVAAIETEQDRRLDESLAKELSGGDRVRARHMRQDFWEFMPTHKIWLATNHKPIVRGADDGIWRRLPLIPFEAKFSDEESGKKKDRKLPEKLKAEFAGILRWAVAGCLTWQKSGLGEPAIVQQATKQYRDQMDVLGSFIADRCILGKSYSIRASALYHEFKTWAEDQGERLVSQKVFGTMLTDRGLERFTSNGVHYRGITVSGST